MTALTTGIHHLGLTVLDVDQARDFFTEALGFHVVGGKPDYPAHFVSDGTTMFTLWQADDDARSFDRRGCIGLHHLALRIDGDLDALHQRLAARDDVQLEFAPERLGTTQSRHMMIRGPSGLRIELIAPSTP